MRYITADIIYPLYRDPIKEGVLVVDNDGLIIDLLESRKGIVELETYDGFLCPGFVNTHCHLELSHMLGEIPEKTGLPDFIFKVSKKRKATQEKIQSAIIKADADMKANGIVAVGDISNTADTFLVKQKSTIKYHTFIELFDIENEKALPVLENGLRLSSKCPTINSLSPHATYSISDKLFDLISKNNRDKISCIHNQETLTEDLFFRKGAGTLFDKVIKNKKFSHTGNSALRTTLPKLSQSPLLLVHNTYTSFDDVKWAESYHSKLFWCTCPKANLYIEGRLPDYQNFSDVKMTIGTDSLASNSTLSIWDEIRTLKKNTEIDINILLEWACKNGAEFLQLPHLGSFQKGKYPGVNLINGTDVTVLI